MQHTDISKFTIAKLQSVAVFGIGSFVLFVLFAMAIMWFHAKKSHESQDAAMQSVLSGMTRAYFVILLYEMFVTLVFIAMVGAAGSSVGGGNAPAEGMWAFWFVDWLDPVTYNSILTGVLSSNSNELESGKVLAGIIIISRYIYILTIIAYWGLMYRFVSGIFFSKSKRNGSQSEFNMAFDFMLVVMVASLVFGSLIFMIGGFMESVFVMSNNTSSTNFSDISVSLHHDLKTLIVNGIKGIGALVNPAP